MTNNSVYVKYWFILNLDDMHYNRDNLPPDLLVVFIKILFTAYNHDNVDLATV